MNPLDPRLQKGVDRLYTLNLYGRWIFVVSSWLILAPLAIWGLRHDIPLWFDYFTWAAVRYAFYYNHISTLCLSFCVAVTGAVLVWQSQNLLAGGIAPRERKKLERQASRILHTGPKHPLWKWVFPSQKY